MPLTIHLGQPGEYADSPVKKPVNMQIHPELVSCRSPELGRLRLLVGLGGLARGRLVGVYGRGVGDLGRAVTVRTFGSTIRDCGAIGGGL
jgi:hypothetical protein